MKLHYCFLEKFNNYFNRKIIKYSTLEDYKDNSQDFFIPEKENGEALPFDFNPNDNVMTEIIGNEVPFTPDYILLFDDELNIVSRWFILEEKRNRQGQWTYTLRRDVVSDNLETLLEAPIFVEKGMLPESDPFTVNDEGMSLNQIKESIELLKDTTGCAWVVGYVAKDAIGSDTSVQVDTYDPKDYVTLSDIAQKTEISEAVLGDIIESQTPAYFTRKIKMSWRNRFSDNVLYTSVMVEMSTSDLNGSYAGMRTPDDASYYLLYGYYNNVYETWDNIISNMISQRTSLYSDMPTIMNRSNFLIETQLNKLQEYEGKRVYYLGNYYKFHISISSIVTQDGEKDFSYKKYTSIKSIIENSISSGVTLTDNGIITGVYTDNVLASIQLLPDEADDSANAYTVAISTSRNKIKGQEFDMFCIPFGSINGVLPYANSDENRDFKTMNIAQIISSAISLKDDAKVYDVQLLPYCPCLQDFFTNPDYEDPVVLLDNLTEHEDYEYIYGPVNTAMDLTVKIMIYDMTHVPFAFSLVRITEGLPACQVIFAGGSANIYIPPEITISSVSYFKIEANKEGITNVNVTYTVDTDTNIINITGLTFDYPADQDVTKIFMDVYFKYVPTRMPCSIMFYPRNASFSGKILKSIVSTETQKVESNTSLYRLVSPNYQGTFDFNLAKNGGRCDTFNYYCTYKPYTPFIKVTPEFNFLYGADYNDNRGLICGGDFSLPRISGAWESYQLQNKNYQNIFNRDIQNLDFMQSIEMRNQRVSGAVGVIADTAKGAGAGAYVGGVAGGLIGGALGGITSGIGYAIDTDTLARTQREQRQLAIDKYNYQLGNIKALPYTLTKVGSFDVSSKIFPFLEHYVCSEQEKEAFKKKIKYESMTVMRIGTLSEFMNFNNELNYFKGALIRNDEIADDPHTLNAIYEELLKGVYI